MRVAVHGVLVVYKETVGLLGAQIVKGLIAAFNKTAKPSSPVVTESTPGPITPLDGRVKVPKSVGVCQKDLWSPNCTLFMSKS
jgi:hypothetical protein